MAQRPGIAIQSEIDARGWVCEDLAFVVGLEAAFIQRLIDGQRVVTPTLSMQLADAFGVCPGYFLDLQDKYDLEKALPADPSIKRRARLAAFPITEMCRRGWIERTDDIEKMEHQFMKFFNAETLDDIPFLSSPE